MGSGYQDGQRRVTAKLRMDQVWYKGFAKSHSSYVHRKEVRRCTKVIYGTLRERTRDERKRKEVSPSTKRTTEVSTRVSSRLSVAVVPVENREQRVLGFGSLLPSPSFKSVHVLHPRRTPDLSGGSPGLPRPSDVWSFDSLESERT